MSAYQNFPHPFLQGKLLLVLVRDIKEKLKEKSKIIRREVQNFYLTHLD